MIVQNILNNSNIKYKLQEYDDNINIYKIGTTKVINIVSITENGNVFKLDEDFNISIKNNTVKILNLIYIHMNHLIMKFF